MAVTQQDLDNLNAAISTGVRSVTIGGITTIYNTTESLIKARDDMRKELTAQTTQSSGKRRQKQSYMVQSGRGY